MLLHYKFNNFYSFYDMVEFDMIASGTKARNRYLDNFVDTECGENILKTAVLVGENAGGKSNFINSLKFLKSLFQDNDNVRALKSTTNINNITTDNPLDCDTEQHFVLEILAEDNLIYLYELVIDFCGVKKEVLYYRKKKEHNLNKVLEVKRLTLDVGDKNLYTLHYEIQIPDVSKEIKDLLEENTNKNKSLGLNITKLAILGVEHTAPFVDWVNNSLYTETIDINYDVYKNFKKEEDDLRILDDPRFIDIFRLVDYSIKRVDIDKEKPYTKSIIVRSRKDGGDFNKEISRDSSGVREYFAWAVQIFRVVYENKVVFADEMDRVLNPILSDRVISFINGKQHRGQFVFSTHNVLHLDLKTYMKEQIYFITKDKETLNSELYSLADFPEVRYETTKIYEFYMKGILGGTSFE